MILTILCCNIPFLDMRRVNLTWYYIPYPKKTITVYPNHEIEFTLLISQIYLQWRKDILRFWHFLECFPILKLKTNHYDETTHRDCEFLLVFLHICSGTSLNIPHLPGQNGLKCEVVSPWPEWSWMWGGLSLARMVLNVRWSILGQNVLKCEVVYPWPEWS